jgi:hypothetical protein
MSSSGMLYRVALVRTDVSEEPSASIIRVTRIGDPETLAVTSNRRIPHGVTSQNDILHRHRRENLRSYIIFLLHILPKSEV